MSMHGLKARLNKAAGMLILACMSGCGNGGLAPGPYMQWVEQESNGCIRTRMISGIKLTAMHRPLEYVALKECRGDYTLLDSMKSSFAGLEYYTLKMSASGHNKDFLLYNLGSEEEYYKRVNYYTVNAQQDVYLVRGADTLPCELYHYERTYGVTPYNNMLLGFRAENGDDKMPALLHVSDRLFHTGLHIFSFEKKNLPVLNH